MINAGILEVQLIEFAFINNNRLNLNQSWQKHT